MLLYRSGTGRTLVVDNRTHLTRLAVRVRPGVTGRRSSVREGHVDLAVVHSQLALDPPSVREVPDRWQQWHDGFSELLTGHRVRIVDLNMLVV
jgi:hypothetical protein